MPPAGSSRRKAVDVPFKNYELIMVLVLVIAVILMVTAFVKISIEHEEDLDERS